MGQLCDVAHHALATDVLAQGKAELGFGAGKLGRLDNIPQVDGADNLIGHLDTHGGNFIRDGRDTHVDYAQGQSQVAGQVGDPGQLDPLLQLDIIPGDCGAPGDIDDRGVDAKAADGPFQSRPVHGDFIPGVDGGGCTAAQQGHRRELIIALLSGGGNGLCHGLSLGADLGFDGLAAFRRVGDLAAHGDGLEILPLLLLHRRDHIGNGGRFLRRQGHCILCGAQGRFMDNPGLFTRSILDFLLFFLFPGGFLLWLHLVGLAGRLHWLGSRFCPAAFSENEVIILIPQGDIHDGAAGNTLNFLCLSGRDLPGDSAHGGQRVLIQRGVIGRGGPDLYLLSHLLEALAEGADGAGDESHHQYRQRAIDAEGHFQPHGQQAAQHPGGFQILAGFKQLPGGELQVKFCLKGRLIQHQAQNRGQQHRQQQGAEAAQHHRPAPVEAQDHRHHKKYGGAQPVAPAYQALDQVGEEEDKAALRLKIADGDKHSQKQKQHRAQLPPDGKHRLLWGRGVHRLAVCLALGVRFAFAVILARCGVFLGLCHGMVPFFGVWLRISWRGRWTVRP